MNNNRGNNRRRGRNNNRPQGGQQLNRIDSRARGNAPQLLEKYRKLAHDHHLNGDRVTAEYYLQFADHYFRVLADARVRQEEQRARRDDRWQEGGEADREDGEDSAEFAGAGDFPSFDAAPTYVRRDREDRPREDRPHRQERPSPPAADGEDNPAGDDAAPRSIYEPDENPFLRDQRENRDNRDSRDTRAPRPRRNENRSENRSENRDARPPRGKRVDAEQQAPAGLDPASLPPAISVVRGGDEGEAKAAAPKPRTRRKAADVAGEPKEALG